MLQITDGDLNLWGGAGGKEAQDGKTFLPWSVYRKEQKRARGVGKKVRVKDVDEDAVVGRRRQMGERAQSIMRVVYRWLRGT